jgi:hypothetical protein
VKPTARSANPASTPTTAPFAPLRAFLHVQGTGAPSDKSAAALVLALLVLSTALGLVLPATAGAYATAGPAPVPGSPGLPDGRVYELVSPANKPGTEAAPEIQGSAGMIWAAADGNGAAFNSTGPLGNAPNGLEFFSVARRSVGGWETNGAMPHTQGGFHEVTPSQPSSIGFSADFTKSIFTANEPFVPGEPAGSLEKGIPTIFNVYAYGIGTGPTVWLGEPLISNPVSPFPGYPKATKEGPLEEEHGLMTGASPDLSIVYFYYLGGFYEWHEGRVSSAGVMPDGSLDPYGAVPAGFNQFATQEGRSQDSESRQNEVSEDGRRAFFVSPAPGTNYPAVDVPQLYVRETAADGTQSTVLVSRDTLLPSVNGLPAAAPHGPLPFTSANTNPQNFPVSNVWATPDGSRAFFLSADQLTAEAPADNSGKLYEFNLDTNTLAYLPGATPPTTDPKYPAGAAVLASSRDGSRLLFERFVTESNGRSGQHATISTELDLWTDGPEGPRDGQITPIAPLIERTQFNVADFPFTRTASDGSSFVFQTREAFPAFHFNNGGGQLQQVYRYDVAASSLTCLSCPPAGVTPSQNADLSTNAQPTDQPFNKDRGISENGHRVFFDTPDPLVPWDTNTAPPIEINADGGRNGNLLYRGYDVYEWENGRLFLISTGKSGENSYVGDNSASGSDAFFSTAEGLVPGDTDGGYDVYDARIPHPGDTPPAQAVPCQGDVCQGPPSVPALLGAPASATFSGLGNIAPEPAAKPAVKQKPKSKPAKCKRGYVKKNGKCVKKPKAKKSAKKSNRKDK